MRFKTVLWALLIGAFGTSFAAISYAAGKQASDTAIPLEELPAACKKAKTEFRPLTQLDAAQAKADMIQALDRLDQRLILAGENGNDWREYLLWGELRNELRDDKSADRNFLARVYQRYVAAHDGLELVWFLDVQRAIRSYIATANAVGNPQVQTAYGELLDKLTASLEAYIAKPTTENSVVISESVRWLEDARQAPALVQAIQHHFVHPNLLVEISADVVAAGIAEPVDDTTSVRDCILGTDIHGTAHTKGETSVALSPDSEMGVIDTLFFGVTKSKSVGYNGPVTIFSSATTDMAARKRLWIHAGGLLSYPSVANAETKINIHGIQSRKGRRLIERMAWRRAGKQQAMAECIASRRAEQRLNKRIDQQADESLDRANQAYIDKFRRPFTERKLFPQTLRFSTTERALHVLGLQAGSGKLAAPGTPPPVVEGADMSLRLHESMVNNLMLDALSGRTVQEEKVQATVTDLLGHLPEKMKGDEDGKPWAITFARRRPISVTFADDGFEIIIRGAKFYKGGDAHPGMDISASYKIEKSPKGFKAVRVGDIRVFPPDFVPDSGAKIDARRQVIRKLLENRFSKVFEPEFLGEGLELPGKWKSAGKMLPLQVVCRDGWLIIAWKRAAAEPNSSPKKSALGTASR